MSNQLCEAVQVSSPLPVATSPEISDTIAASWLAALQRAEIGRARASHASLLGWLLVLPSEVDPAAAASAVLARQQQLPQAVLSSELTQLLQQVAIFPTSRLARMRRQRRRLNS
jgi:hypothetical protein